GRGIAHERLFRFEFPERPGALLKFLNAIGTQWNITLFHYRNHGSDHGRVLAGVQVPPQESVDFDLHLRELKYVYVEETQNPANEFLGRERKKNAAPPRAPRKTKPAKANPVPNPHSSWRVFLPWPPWRDGLVLFLLVTRRIQLRQCLARALRDHGALAL